jgi:hypothetical protein
LLQIQNTLFVNLENVTYVEFTGKGGADIHFVGKTKALRLKRGEVGHSANIFHREICARLMKPHKKCPASVAERGAAIIGVVHPYCTSERLCDKSAESGVG